MGEAILVHIMFCSLELGVGGWELVCVDLVYSNISFDVDIYRPSQHNYELLSNQSRVRTQVLS